MVCMVHCKVCTVMTFCAGSVEPSGSAITYFSMHHQNQKKRRCCVVVVLLFRFTVPIVGILIKTLTVRQKKEKSKLMSCNRSSNPSHKH
jgi:hypothetical protein